MIASNCITIVIGSIEGINFLRRLSHYQDDSLEIFCPIFDVDHYNIIKKKKYLMQRRKIAKKDLLKKPLRLCVGKLCSISLLFFSL